MNENDVFSDTATNTNFSKLLEASINESKNNSVISNSNKDGDFLGTFADAIPILRNSYSKGEQNRIITGIKEIDQITGGIRKGQLWVIGARPGCGKTTFAVNLLTQLSKLHQEANTNNKSLFVSLEMSKIEIFKKFVSISSIAELKDTEKFFSKYFSKDENSNALSSEQIFRFTQALKNNYLFFAEFVQECNLDVLEETIRSAVSKNSVKVVAIDYFQLLGTATVEFGSRSEKLASISRALKRLAKNLNINIILLSQLSRDFEKKGSGTTPSLSDLKETGSLEQDADVVLFLYEDSEQFKKNKTISYGKWLKLYIAKNRNGATKEIDLLFWLSHSIMLTSSQMEAAKNTTAKKETKAETPITKVEVVKQEAKEEPKPVEQEIKAEIKQETIKEEDKDFLDLDIDYVTEGEEMEFYANN